MRHNPEQTSTSKKPEKLVETARAHEIGKKGSGLYQYLACIHCGKARWVALIRGKPVSLRCRTCGQLQAQVKRRKPYYRHLYSPSYPVKEKTDETKLAWLAGIWDSKGSMSFVKYSGMGKGYEYPDEARTTCPECGRELRSYQGYLRHWSLVHKGASIYEKSPAPIYYLRSERILRGKGRKMPTLRLMDSDENIIDEAFRLLKKLGTDFKKLERSFAKDQVSYLLIASNMASIGITLDAILPYLVGKKAQAEFLLRYIKERPHHKLPRPSTQPAILRRSYLKAHPRARSEPNGGL